jgi:ABC-type multidrug transport system fused ATPase/permease subunit
MNQVYEKSLRLSSASKQKTPSGEAGKQNIFVEVLVYIFLLVNLISNDSQRIYEMCCYADFAWIVPIVMITALIVLWTQIGVSTLAGFALVLIIMAIQMKVGKKIGSSRRNMLKISDNRVKFMNEILQGIRVIKLYAWEKSVCDEIKRLRKLEIAFVRLINMLKAFNMVIVFVWPAIATFCVITLFVYIGNDLNVGSFFLILNFLNLLRYPTVMFPLGVNTLVEGFVSLKRLSKYLSLPEVDYVGRINDENEIRIQDADFCWDAHDANIILSNINLKIETGSLVALVGKVGTGKSSLISALLGEMACVRGNYSTSNSVGYMAQSSWIQNASLRDNILCRLPYEHDLYENVVRATSLVEDFKVLQKGDLTDIGERGINLSGGQKSRISLARVAYRHKILKTYFLDDPFAAVDMSVGEHIFSECILKLLHDKTRVLAMNSHLHLLKHFHQIIVLGETSEISGDGRFQNTVLFQGDYSTLKERFPELLDRDSSPLSKESTKIESSSSVISTEKFANNKEDSDKLIVKEDRVEGLVKWSTYLTYFQFGMQRCRISFIFFIIFTYSIGQLFRILCDIWAVAWANRSYFGDKSIEFWAGIYGVLLLLTALISVIRSSLFVELSVRSSISLHDSMFSNLMLAPITTFFGK